MKLGLMNAHGIDVWFINGGSVLMLVALLARDLSGEGKAANRGTRAVRG